MKETFLNHVMEEVAMGDWIMIAYMCEKGGCKKYEESNIHPQYFCRGCELSYKEVER